MMMRFNNTDKKEKQAKSELLNRIKKALCHLCSDLEAKRQQIEAEEITVWEYFDLPNTTYYSAGVGVSKSYLEEKPYVLMVEVSAEDSPYMCSCYHDDFSYEQRKDYLLSDKATESVMGSIPNLIDTIEKHD